MKPLLGMLAFLVLTNIGILGVTHGMGPQREGWALFGCWLLNLLVVGIAAAVVSKATWEAPGAFIVIILLAVYACVYGAAGGRAPKVFQTRESPVLKMEEIEIDRVSGFDVWHFSDGRIDMDLSGHRELKARRTLHYYAAPVVYPGWTKENHVPAWVVYSDMNSGVPANWKKPCVGGYSPGFDENYRILVEETSRNRKLSTLDNAPILICSEDPRSDFLGTAWIELGGLLLIDLVGIVTAILGAMKPGTPAP